MTTTTATKNHLSFILFLSFSTTLVLSSRITTSSRFIFPSDDENNHHHSTLSALLGIPSLASLLELHTSTSNSFPGGTWTVLKDTIGISAMHMQLLYNNKVIVFDRTDFGRSNLSLPAGKPCRNNDKAIGRDCTAHSVLYDIASNSYRPLTVRTDTWCSSGSIAPDGTLIQTGGYNSGERIVRTFTPCKDENNVDSCDWKELPSFLSARRWYASNHILPEGGVIVVGGRSSHSYEFFPKDKSMPVGANYMSFLKETWDGNDSENNLYPFLHILPDGNLYIFANNRSILFDYKNNRVVKEFPVLAGTERRCYPSTGSSVLLPLVLDGNEPELPPVEVMICGGTPYGSFQLADNKKTKIFLEASRTCGRISLTDPNPQWMMEEMPTPRVMGDTIILPTGDVLIINGAANGSAGWENADNPILTPVLYRTYETDPNNRFVTMNPSKIPRLYHSAAILIPDGRILVSGSNPHVHYNFTGVKYPTDLSLEAFSPHYLDLSYGSYRPSILTIETNNYVLSYGQIFAVTFDLPVYKPEEGVAVTMVFPPFTTHSFGMNQRMVMLRVLGLNQLSDSGYKVTVRAPINVNVALPGYYMLFVVHSGVPSSGVWVRMLPAEVKVQDSFVGLNLNVNADTGQASVEVGVQSKDDGSGGGNGGVGGSISSSGEVRMTSERPVPTS